MAQGKSERQVRAVTLRVTAFKTFYRASFFFIIPSLIILRTPSLLLFFLLFFFWGGTRKHWTWKSSWGVGEAVTGNRATCQPKSRASTWSSVSSFQTIIITNFRVIMMSRPESTKPQKRERNKRCEKSKAKDYVVRTNNIAKAATIPGIRHRNSAGCR